jgi:hypothetical protein
LKPPDAADEIDEEEDPEASAVDDTPVDDDQTPMDADQPPLPPSSNTGRLAGLDHIKNRLHAFSDATSDGVMPSIEAWTLIADAIVETLRSLDILKRSCFVMYLIQALKKKSPKESKVVHANTLATVFLLSMGKEVTTSEDQKAKRFYAPNGQVVMVDVTLACNFIFLTLTFTGNIGDIECQDHYRVFG